MFKYVVCGLLFLVASLTSTAASAHPSDGYSPLKVEPSYGTENWGLPAEWSIGDIYFSREFERADSLTPEEQYIAFGSSGSSFGTALLPWYDSVYQFVMAFYHENKYVPQQLSPEIISAMYEGDLLQSSLEILKSPITGQYPRLDANSFSPGDVYMRVLTESEKQHFAGLNPWYAYLWYGDTSRIAGGTYQQAPLPLGDVFFIRVYGQTGVLVEYINCTWIMP